MKKYVTPVVDVLIIEAEGVLAASIGGNTGYDGNGIISGGDLSDDDDF